MGELPRASSESDEGDSGSSEWDYSLPRDAEGNVDFDALTVYSDYDIPGTSYVFNLRTGWTTDEDQPDLDSPTDQTEPDV